MPARFLCIAGDDRVGGIGRILAVDVRAGREDARPGQAVGRDHLAQLEELLVPLPGIAERGDAVRELPQRQPRIVLDVEVQIDQPGDHGLAGEIDALGIRRRCHRRRRADGGDALALHDDAAVLDRCAAGAVDDAHVVENERAGLLRDG